MAIQVKSGASGPQPRGLDAFASAFRPDRQLVVGSDGIPLERFPTTPAERWLARPS